MKFNPLFIVCLLAIGSPSTAEHAWIVETQEDWSANTNHQTNLAITDGKAAPTQDTATFQSIIKQFDAKTSVGSIVFEQSVLWQNWSPVANIGPTNLGDAPVLLSLGPNDYWMFGRYRGVGKPKKGGSPRPPFTAQDATLSGFDIPLQTTPWNNQFDAPGGLEKRQGGYHAWQSRDMVNWVYHGQVTENFSRWTTTAEYTDGKLYLYYDFPNDQDPHVYVDDNLFDGKPGQNMGMAFKDPSHGSDCAIIRDLDGTFHLIYEDWSPINAKKRSWDSPLAGHAVSENGIKDFHIRPPAVDYRTTPTGETASYKHPHWTTEDPDNYPSNVAEYRVHAPEQEAYGDWAAISIGGRYYLFGDYDAHEGGTMSVAWFTSPNLNEPFVKCDSIGKGHPDPDVCFAQGQFYLATQQRTDYVSPGPWVESVATRVGVDTDNDGAIDQWSAWHQVKESYDHIPGFAKQIHKTPASADLSDLPAGFGFQFEVKIIDTTENKSKPILDRVKLLFQN